MENHQLINQTSGKTEYQTPPFIVEAARRMMGGIELDPASSYVANRKVGADRFYNIIENGLDLDWTAASVWLNHPYSRQDNAAWVAKAVEEYRSGRAKQICMITYAATSEKWFRPLLNFPICFLHKRVSFLNEDGTVVRGNTKGSCVTYLGSRIEDFFVHFIALGSIMLPMPGKVLWQ